MRYVRLPRLNIAGIQSASVPWGSHSDWMITLLCPDLLKCQSSLLTHLGNKNTDKADLPCFHTVLVVNGLQRSGTVALCLISIFDNPRMAKANYRQQLLFNICCKQEVSRGMQCPSPFSGSSSKAPLWTTSMLLFIGCNVGCPGKPQSKWQRKIIWRLNSPASWFPQIMSWS